MPATCCASASPGETRCWHDPVMWSNSAYVAVAGHAFYVGVYDVAVLSCAVSFASSLYHLHSERCYLALDASFAGLIFLMSILCLIDALKYGVLHWMVVGSAVTFPTLIYLFIASDLPGTKHYDSLHTIWHFVTALGTAAVALYLEAETINKTSLELFRWEAFCLGVAFALSCLWVMRDVVERTFLNHLREIISSSNAFGTILTQDNQIIVRGCRVSARWFWVGMVLQLCGIFTMLALGTSDLAALLVGASLTSFLYNRLHHSCELALDLTLSALSILAAAGAILMHLGYTRLADGLIFAGSALLPVAFGWTALKLSFANQASATPSTSSSGPSGGKHQHTSSCACFKVNAFTSVILDPVRRQEFWHHRVSHSLVTICNLSAASACLVAALLH